MPSPTRSVGVAPVFVCPLLELASVTIALWGFPRAGAMEELDGGEGVAQLR